MSTIETQPAADYHRDPSLSATIAKILCQQSPLHAWAAHPALNPNYVREEAAHLDLGTICHALMLEGEDVAHVIQATKTEGTGKSKVDTGEPVTDYKSKAAQIERDEARAAGKCPILAREMPGIKSMMDALLRQIDNHAEANDCFKFGKPEQVIKWQEPGVKCRARLDWLHDSLRIVDDYKTTAGSASPADVARNIVANGWDIQAAFYIRAVKSLHPDIGDVLFRFVIQETYDPFAMSVVSLTPGMLDQANRKVEFAIKTWAQCLNTNYWPGYTRRIAYAESNPWDEERWLAREGM